MIDRISGAYISVVLRYPSEEWIAIPHSVEDTATYLDDKQESALTIDAPVLNNICPYSRPRDIKHCWCGCTPTLRKWIDSPLSVRHQPHLSPALNLLDQ